mgnify:CR=1 FL=1
MQRSALGFIGLFLSTSAMAQEVPQVAPDAASDVAAITEQFGIDRSNRMTVQVRVNGSDAVPFIVDTGATAKVVRDMLPGAHFATVILKYIADFPNDTAIGACGQPLHEVHLIGINVKGNRGP